LVELSIKLFVPPRIVEPDVCVAVVLQILLFEPPRIVSKSEKKIKLPLPPPTIELAPVTSFIFPPPTD
jgi:hypothetical protein